MFWATIRVECDSMLVRTGWQHDVGGRARKKKSWMQTITRTGHLLPKNVSERPIDHPLNFDHFLTGAAFHCLPPPCHRYLLYPTFQFLPHPPTYLVNFSKLILASTAPNQNSHVIRTYVLFPCLHTIALTAPAVLVPGAMSSPSSTGSTKRKRGAASDRLKSSTIELQQPSSRDASGEELADESPATNTRQRKHNASNDTTNSGLPPSKRARTRSNASASLPANGPNSAEAGNSTVAAEDPGEPSSTTEDSAEIENKAKRRQNRTGSVTNKANGNTAEEPELDDTERKMEAPPRAGLRDPIGGYKTNPPPTGRAVRVYADGVFDLFHLG